MHRNIKRPLSFIVLAACGLAAQAADWSDTSVGYRYGSQFREPYNPDDIAKSIVDLQHVSGYRYGTNFFNVDLLLSNGKDPAALNSSNGAHEAYVVYRHFLDLGKVAGKDLKFGPVRGAGLTAGFDWNVKTDVGYNSKKRMFVFGPTVEIDVPGFLNVSLLQLWESNAPSGYAFPAPTFAPTAYSVNRYHYKAHPMLNLVWGIPVGALPLSFEGYANFIASKGKDEFGGSTAAETNIDMQLMLDAGSFWGKPKSFKIGLEYQYWKNKFGNNSAGPAGSGAFAKTPMIRAEYHF